MKRPITLIFSGLILMLSFAAPLAAGTLEDAKAARNRGDYATALRLYRLAAGQGNASAQSTLGYMYSRGEGVPRDDTEAARWYLLAAQQGSADAQYELMLGIMYHHGEVVPKDFAQAAKWLRLAANQGNADAESMLGFMYHEGEGVPKDFAEAAKWSRLGADQGNAGAQSMLAFMYHQGEGVPQDLVKAYMWLILSAAQGDQLAEKNRDMLTRQMTPAQLAEAQNQAAEWRPKKASNTALAETMPLSPSPETSEPDAAR